MYIGNRTYSKRTFIVHVYNVHTYCTSIGELRICAEINIGASEMFTTALLPSVLPYINKLQGLNHSYARCYVLVHFNTVLLILNMLNSCYAVWWMSLEHASHSWAEPPTPNTATHTREGDKTERTWNSEKYKSYRVDETDPLHTDNTHGGFWAESSN